MFRAGFGVALMAGLTNTRLCEYQRLTSPEQPNLLSFEQTKGLIYVVFPPQ